MQLICISWIIFISIDHRVKSFRWMFNGEQNVFSCSFFPLASVIVRGIQSHGQCQREWMSSDNDSKNTGACSMGQGAEISHGSSCPRFSSLNHLFKAACFAFQRLWLVKFYSFLKLAYYSNHAHMLGPFNRWFLSFMTEEAY